jgi:hypothetical protein
MPAYTPIEGRLWANIDKRGPTECWLWTGYLNAAGYELAAKYGVSKSVISVVRTGKRWRHV